jgi:hypothetical protein
MDPPSSETVEFRLLQHLFSVPFMLSEELPRFHLKASDMATVANLIGRGYIEVV